MIPGIAPRGLSSVPRSTRRAVLITKTRCESGREPEAGRRGTGLITARITRRSYLARDSVIAFACPRPASSDRFATMRPMSPVDRAVLDTRLSDQGIDVKTGSSGRRRRSSCQARSAASGSSSSYRVIALLALGGRERILMVASNSPNSTCRQRRMVSQLGRRAPSWPSQINARSLAPRTDESSIDAVRCWISSRVKCRGSCRDFFRSSLRRISARAASTAGSRAGSRQPAFKNDERTAQYAW